MIFISKSEVLAKRLNFLGLAQINQRLIVLALELIAKLLDFSFIVVGS